MKLLSIRFSPHLLLCFLLFISPHKAFTHDFWLEAQPFYSKLGSNVDIGIYVGEDMFGEALPNIPDNYSDFSYTDQELRKKIDGKMARYPAGYFKPSLPGYYSVGYRSNENLVVLDAEKFNQYLQAEGLQKIMDYRIKHQQSDLKAREIYSRCVKTIVKVGDKARVDYSQQAFNYTLEIIPLKNPYQLQIGAELPIQVNYLGQPIENILISAFTKETPWERFDMRTDSNGQVKIKLNRSGHWIIRGVEMIASKRADIDWESFWASLTFKLK